MKEFNVKSDSFPLYKAFKEECEKIGWKYNHGFTPFEEEQMSYTKCMFFTNNWGGMPTGPMFAFSNSTKNTFQLETQYGEALAFAKEQFNYKPKRWRAGEGERYYLVTSMGDVEWYCEDGDSSDDEYWEMGNYFQTEEEAEIASKKVKELLLSLQKVS